MFVCVILLYSASIETRKMFVTSHRCFNFFFLLAEAVSTFSIYFFLRFEWYCSLWKENFQIVLLFVFSLTSRNRHQILMIPSEDFKWIVSHLISSSHTSGNAIISLNWNDSIPFCVNENTIKCKLRNAIEHWPKKNWGKVSKFWLHSFPETYRDMGIGWNLLRAKEEKVVSQSTTCTRLNNKWHNKKAHQSLVSNLFFE